MTTSVRIAVDIGGTFTDIEVLDGATGLVHQFKTPSTPRDPSVGLIEGIRQASRKFGFDTAHIEQILHGTTIATNAVLERKLPDGAVLTTAGFEDVLAIGRHGRRDVYAITLSPPPPLIPRRHAFGVVERVRADGSVETALDEASVRAAAARIREAGASAVAVCFLHAYANPVHERRAGAILAEELPGIAISLSSDISLEIREYERLSTTVLNALLMPVVSVYAARLESRLREADLTRQIYLVQSNGGVSGLAKAAREPARLLLSGPSGGAAAARRLAAALDEPNLIAVDMGGTSFDISVVHQGAVATVNEGEIDGLPVRLPMVEMRTIGAGGGSIAWVDNGGRLRIGPHSAGAVPGPACYGRGGLELTVTDANLILGRLDAKAFMGGAMTLDRDKAVAAAAPLARALGLSIEEIAAGVVAVVNSNLSTAIRLSLFEKGLDPDDFALLSFGGAGGVHACEVADDLGVNRVIFPEHASTLSAWGILWSDITHDLTTTDIGPLERAGERLARHAVRMTAEAERLFAEDGTPKAARELRFSLDLRYAGQAFDLPVPVDGADFSPSALAEISRRFHAVHRQRFSYDEPHTAVEMVALRLAAIGRLPKPVPSPGTNRPAETAPMMRPVHVDGRVQDVAVFERGGMADQVARGPAIVSETYTSSYIPPGWSAAIASSGALIARRLA
ncbi:MAG: hydantoinase/oxoprolinase family protein [Phreatobacter sp.]|uniref:hydantoinase/oxoprolinase family protein n=1 Tax=Phreatobacter sp. TaxID=1966341 RepID=UPI0027373A78|nr:hydantoinase/oxoprolinase family protein [Phreatobacter sp.]MDP2802106.1 hydantoinase/oxoprolinase family protein [Phreatobacter sp.]